MRVAVISVLLTLLVLFLAGTGVLYLGVYNVAATDGHWPVVRWVMEQTRLRSIRAHAAGIAPPASLDDPAALRLGVEHFAAHCAVCHGAPGVPRGEIAKGMYPLPPDLAQTAARYSPAELFWIVKNGLKMTGMPSWSDHEDQEIWATVAFLQKLPTMTEPDYVRLLQGAMMGGGSHSHGAGQDEDAHEEHEHQH